MDTRLLKQMNSFEKKANDFTNGLIALIIIIGIPVAIIAIAWEEWTRDPELTELYNRSRTEAREKADRDIVNRYLFEQSLKQR